MIDFQKGEITQILPSNIRADPKVQAISFAIHKQIEKIVEKTMNIGIYAKIDVLPEDILDLMAVELRSQYYEQDMPLDKKREIIKNTMAWYYRAGTPAAVKELIQVVFGTGSTLSEWWEYGGEPYLFKIIVDDQENLLTEEQWKKIQQSLKYVKNTRSHLESVQYLRYGKTMLNAGIGVSGYTLSVIGKKVNGNGSMEGTDINGKSQEYNNR